jgi:NAD(P)H dehydrogenase (quinone)
MHVHIVHAHPEPSSFNGALTKTAERALAGLGHTVFVHDLYASGFDPVERGSHYGSRVDENVFAPLGEQRHAWQHGALPSDVRGEIDKLEHADLMILQFPLWWHAPPAILKGWFDRVVVNGGLYTSQTRYNTGYFRGRKAMISVTTGAPEKAFGPGSRGGDFDTMLWPVQYSLHSLGYSILPPFISYGVQGHGYVDQDKASLAAHLEQTLADWAIHLTRTDDLTPLDFPGWNDWDAEGQSIHVVS